VVSASSLALGALFDLLAGDFISTSPRGIFKAQPLCLRSGMVTARSRPGAINPG